MSALAAIARALAEGAASREPRRSRDRARRGRGRAAATRSSCAPRSPRRSCSRSWPSSAGCPGCRAAGPRARRSRRSRAPRCALWRGPAEGRVRIAQPLPAARRRAPATCSSPRFRTASSRAATPADPLPRRRAARALGLAALAAPRPGRRGALPLPRLRLAPDRAPLPLLAAADDEGAPAARSPFIDEVRDLLGAATRGRPQPSSTRTARARAGRVRARRGADRARAARALAAPVAEPTPRSWRGRGGGRAGGASASRAADPRARPAARARGARGAGERRVLGASTLEGWLGCPYRWFVEHELRPQRLDPESEPLRLGGLVHDALERLYREPPGERRDPAPGRPRPLASRASPSCSRRPRERGPGARREPRGRDRARPAASPGRGASSREEAELETELRPRPDLLEARLRHSDERRGRRRSTSASSSCAAGSTGSTSPPTGARRWSATTRPAAEVVGAQGLGEARQAPASALHARARELSGSTRSAASTTRSARPRQAPAARDADQGRARASSGLDLVGGDPCDAEEFEEVLERARERGERGGGGDARPGGSAAGRSAATARATAPSSRSAGASARSGSRTTNGDGGRRRVSAAGDPDARAARGDRRPRPRRLPRGRRRDRQDPGAGRPLLRRDRATTGSGSRRSSPSPSPSGPRPSCATRIRRELGAPGRARPRERGDAGLADALDRASRETEGAWVTTIHGFCRRLLAAHPVAAGLDPRFRVLDARARRSRLRAPGLATTRSPSDRARSAPRPVERRSPAYQPLADRRDGASPRTSACAARGWPSRGCRPVDRAGALDQEIPIEERARALSAAPRRAGGDCAARRDARALLVEALRAPLRAAQGRALGRSTSTTSSCARWRCCATRRPCRRA